MKKALLAGLATVLFLLTSTGIAITKDWPLTQEDSDKSKATGLYDNVRILQEQINSLTERLNRIETLHGVEPRFTDMEDGTIRDNDSGLIWLKDASCDNLPHTIDGRADWENANDAAAALKDGTCGLTDGSKEGDWRLPTKAEWEAFMSQVYKNPALVNTVGDAQWSEGDAFNGVQFDVYFYWSSTEYENSGYAWCAKMRDGSMTWTFDPLTYYVWPVRSIN
jgi:hypothetical protein